MNSDNKQIRDVADVAARIMAGLPPIEEALHPNQQKIDVVDDDKIDGKDFAKLRAGKKPDMKKEEIEIEEESHQSKTTMKHIPNASPALKKAAKDIKPGIAGIRDRFDMLDAGGVKREQVEELDEATYDHKKAMQSQNPRIQKKGIGGAMDNAAKRIQQTIKDVPLNSLEKRYKEEVELDEVKMADLPSTKVQGRAYGASKPQPSAFDILKGPKDKELKSIESEKKKKKISEMIAIYKEGGLKTFFESIKKEDLIIEEPDSEQFAKDLEDAKKRAAGTKPQADVAKASVQAVKQEAVEQDIEVLDADLVNGFAEVNIQERTLTAAETDKKEHIVKSMKKGMAGFKERYGDRAKSVMYATATKQAKKD